jgi:4-hydroxybenzoate polyprenyltransferase
MLMKKLLGYIRLTRPYILLSATPFYIGSAFLSVNGLPPIGPLSIGFLTVVLAIAAAHVANDYFDWRLDAKNPRTAMRPIASKLISPNKALLYGLALAIIAFALAFTLNTSSVLVALAAIPLPFIYVCFRRHRIPFAFICPVIAIALIIIYGSTSVTGGFFSESTWAFLILGLIWEPGRDLISEIQDVKVDKAAGILTLPVVLSPRGAAKCVLVLFTASSIVGVIIGFLTKLGIVYFTAAILAGFYLVFRSVELVKEPSSKNAVVMRVRAPRYIVSLCVGIVINYVIVSIM